MGIHMINFLPPEAKSAVRREYVIRALGAWSLLFAVVAMVGTVLLLPTYVLLTRQLDALAAEVVRAEDVSATEAYKTTHDALATANALAVQLRVAHAELVASKMLDAIRSAQTDAVTLSGFSYTHTGTAVKSVQVRGIAATRGALAEFSAALERNPLFARADVPVSDLADDRNLEFTLTIVLSPNST